MPLAAISPQAAAEDGEQRRKIEAVKLLVVRKASIWLRVKTASAASRIILTVHVHEQKYIDQNLVTINNRLCKIQPGQIINDQN